MGVLGGEGVVSPAQPPSPAKVSALPPTPQPGLRGELRDKMASDSQVGQGFPGRLPTPWNP